jgi:hypothetical protein
VEGLLIAVIVFQLSRKSYKPPKKPLSEKVDWFSVHGQLSVHVQSIGIGIGHRIMKHFRKSLEFYLRRKSMSYVMNGNQNLCVLQSKRGPELRHQSWEGLCDVLIS